MKRMTKMAPMTPVANKPSPGGFPNTAYQVGALDDAPENPRDYLSAHGISDSENLRKGHTTPNVEGNMDPHDDDRNEHGGLGGKDKDARFKLKDKVRKKFS